jgi:hypothetical protein
MLIGNIIFQPCPPDLGIDLAAVVSSCRRVSSRRGCVGWAGSTLQPDIAAIWDAVATRFRVVFYSLSYATKAILVYDIANLMVGIPIDDRARTGFFSQCRATSFFWRDDSGIGYRTLAAIFNECSGV